MYTEHYIPVPGTVYRYRYSTLHSPVWQPVLLFRQIRETAKLKKNWRITESGPVWGTECALCTQCLPLPSNPPSCQCQNHSISSFRRTIILLYFQNYCQSFTIYSFVTKTSRINSPHQVIWSSLSVFQIPFITTFRVLWHLFSGYFYLDFTELFVLLQKCYL